MNPKFNRRQFALGLSISLLFGVLLHVVAHSSPATPAGREQHGSTVERIDVHGPDVKRYTVYQQPGAHGAAVVWIEERPST